MSVDGDIIKDSNIYATIYRYDHSGFHPWMKEELQMNIKNKLDALLLTQATSKQCKNQASDYGHKSEILFDPPKKFAFGPISIKPDSTLPWPLLKKRW